MALGILGVNLIYTGYFENAKPVIEPLSDSLEQDQIEIDSSNHALFEIFSREVLSQLPHGRGKWEQCLPDGVAEEIIKHRLLGFRE